MVEGFEIRRLDLARRDFALAVLPKRLYFEGHSSSPTDTPENELFPSGRRPRPIRPETAHETSITEARELAGSSLATDGALLELEDFRTGLSSLSRTRLAGDTVPAGNDRLNALYKQHGFECAPGDAQLLVVPTGRRSERIAGSFATGLARAFAVRGVKVDVRVAREVPETGDGRFAVHVLFDHRREHDARGLRLVRELEADGIRVRRSYADDDLRFSIPEQCASLLQALGGRPHSLLVGGVPDDLWFAGVDMSHRVDERRSILCVTLLDPGGKLVRAWRGEQRLDERIDRSLLGHALDRIVAEVGSEQRDGRIFALRDGRLLDGERHYRQEIGGVAVTWVEVRKRGNPPLWYGADPSVPPADTWARVPDAEAAFYVAEPLPRLGGWGMPIKLTWSGRHDPVGLGIDGIARAVAGLRWAPTLGTKPIRLPAPLYWADGIAGASDTDLRFRGQPVEQL